VLQGYSGTAVHRYEPDLDLGERLGRQPRAGMKRSGRRLVTSERGMVAITATWTPTANRKINPFSRLPRRRRGHDHRNCQGSSMGRTSNAGCLAAIAWIC
jgi:hypothetical protein